MEEDSKKFEEVRKEITLTIGQYLYFEPHNNNYHIVGRHKFINDWVYLKADTVRAKQYLFSISSLTELHDIENYSYQ